MDYAICQALKYHSEGLPFGDVLYDIACQWFVHFLERVEKGEYIGVPLEMAIDAFVGKFHLGAHIRECFVMFSLNFAKGLGIIDGEIMETIWAHLNKAAPSTRVMSKAHRQQMLDNHMREVNWRKLIGLSEWFGIHACTLLTTFHRDRNSEEIQEGSGRREGHGRGIQIAVGECVGGTKDRVGKTGEASV